MALALGRTVAELETAIGEDELREWMAFWALEPFGERAAWERAGLVASLIANANRDPKRRAQPYQPTDFMPKDPPPPGSGLNSAVVKAKLFSAFGGRIKRQPAGGKRPAAKPQAAKG